jgi:hypothetical protein
MKILAAALATCLLAAPALAQGDQGKPAETPESATDAAPASDPNAAPKPADAANATPEPEEAPEGTEPVKPADTPAA